MFQCSQASYSPTNVGCLCHRLEISRLTHRMHTDLTRRGFMAGMAASITSLGLPDFAKAQTTHVPARPDRPIYLTNLRLFDGTSFSLRDGVRLLIEDEKIKAVDETRATAPDGAQVIDCGNRVVMPGLIDVHWHSMLASTPLLTLMSADVGYIYLSASAEAERTLLRGFTSVRDVGGPSFALKRAIDEGLVSGPRIFPSGAIISQTGGHGDFRFSYEVSSAEHGSTRAEQLGASYIADSPDEVRRRTREQLALGASQIKLAAGGGVASLYDPLDTVQFRLEEVRAAVEAAKDWGTYVTVHAYLPASMKRCIAAGVGCIEHGQLTDTEAVQMMVDRNIWWSLQPFTEAVNSNRYPGKSQQEKQKMVWNGTDVAYKLAIDNKMKVGWGTDILFDAKSTPNQGKMLAAMTRWYTPAQALKMATGDNADLLARSGLRNPYDGKVGIIEPNAFADVLVVEGDPTSDLNLVAEPGKNFRLIMKGGRIYRNELPI